MTNTLSVTAIVAEHAHYLTLPFYAGGKPLDSAAHARWGMTLLAAGTMRFRWNEPNAHREQTLAEIFSELRESDGTAQGESGKGQPTAVPVELIHSKEVLVAERAGDTQGKKADGIITQNPSLAPTVTVADCVPIFLYDRAKNAIGAFHSGWRGTGIAGIGVEAMREAFGSRAEDISAAIGPHIGGCCYYVDEERAGYFAQNFGEKCVRRAENPKNPNDAELISRFPFRLSLTEANLSVLKQVGIREENIVVATDCTCCTQFPGGAPVFGSFRRQAAFLPPEINADTRSRAMCVQTAFVYLR